MTCKRCRESMTDPVATPEGSHVDWMACFVAMRKQRDELGAALRDAQSVPVHAVREMDGETWVRSRDHQQTLAALAKVEQHLSELRERHGALSALLEECVDHAGDSPMGVLRREREELRAALRHVSKQTRAGQMTYRDIIEFTEAALLGEGEA